MNSKGNNKLFMLVGLAVILIIQVVIFLKIKPDTSFQIISMFSVIILLAVAAVLFSWYQVRRIENRIKNLPKEYRDVYIDANEYVGSTTLKKNAKKTIMEMVLEIFEHANIENRQIEDVINGNLKEFMEGFIEVSGGTSSKLYYFSYSSALFIGYLIFMKIYEVVRLGDFRIENLKEGTLDYGIVFMYGIIAYIFFPWMLLTIQKASQERWSGIKRLKVILPFIIPFGLVYITIVIDNESFTNFLDKPFPIFTSTLSIVIGIILFGCSIGAMKLAQKLQIKKIH